MLNHENITAVILAGGMARRMGGVDKGWMELNGKPLIKHVTDILSPQVGQIFINANRSLDAYGTLGFPVVSDLEGDYQGPLMGIATGLKHASTNWVLFAPCDGPHLPRNLAEKMLLRAETEGAEIAVAHDGKRSQPVVALVKRELLSSLLATLAEGERKIDRWYAIHKTVEVDFSDSPDAFVNVNRKDDLASLEQLPAILGFAAWSGTGKTTLIKELIPALKEKGIRVGVIKHAHHQFDIDHPGKDSYEIRKSGADQMLICSGKRWALMVEQDQGDRPSLHHMLSQMDHSLLDLVLVEGFKKEPFPKIELHRKAVGKPLLHPEDSHIIACACDEPVEVQRDIPILDLNNINQLVDFIEVHIKETVK